jgi:DMSO/TMAO reductase YedYZ molybdopterin-dependent catalytic subunit
MLTLLMVGILAQAPADSSIKISGTVGHAATLTAADLSAMPQKSVTASSHDQKATCTGVPLRDILTKAGVPAGADVRGPLLAAYVVVTGADGYRAVFALAELDPLFTDRVVLLALKKDDAPLADNAGPYQLIVPGELRPARWVRQVVAISIQSAPPDSKPATGNRHPAQRVALSRAPNSTATHWPLRRTTSSPTGVRPL